MYDMPRYLVILRGMFTFIGHHKTVQYEWSVDLFVLVIASLARDWLYGIPYEAARLAAPSARILDALETVLVYSQTLYH
jgi:hypothetical protein